MKKQISVIIIREFLMKCVGVSISLFFFRESRINAEKSNSLSYTVGQSNWVLCLPHLIPQCLSGFEAEIQPVFKRNLQSGFTWTEGEWIKALLSQHQCKPCTNVNHASQTLLLGKRPSAACSNLCHRGSQTAVQLSTCQRQAWTWLWRCSHCLLFPAVKFQQETCNIIQILHSHCFFP